jgi:beta-glucosidase-like glycosyl hydrolase/uncharacterized protein YbbC (DUF1343 family)
VKKGTRKGKILKKNIPHILFVLFFYSTLHSKSIIQTGAEILLQNPGKYLQNKHFGLLCHKASIVREKTNKFQKQEPATFLPDKLYFWINQQTDRTKLTAIFAPEHGLEKTYEAAAIIQNNSKSRWNCPVYSLYGHVRAPTKNMLRGLDLIVVDLQEIGVRCYTYLSTLVLMLKSAAQNGIPVLLLGRPNPIHFWSASGPFLKKKFESFLGKVYCPFIHGKTITKLAEQENSTIKADLTVLDYDGKVNDIDTYFSTNFTAPSPNLPTINSVYSYPMTVFLEGTNYSEGRGTHRPFQQIGAPWVDKKRLAMLLNSKNFIGVTFEPTSFTPKKIPGVSENPKHKNQLCHGVFLRIKNRFQINTMKVAYTILQTLFEMYSKKSQWLKFNGNKYNIDFLVGNDEWRNSITDANFTQQQINSMSLEEKIGQLFIVQADVNGSRKSLTKLEKLIKKYHIGGLMLFQNNLSPQNRSKTTQCFDLRGIITFLNHYQKTSKFPMFVAVDAEWGLGMRFQGALEYPRNMTLEGIKDESLIYELGKEIGRQCKNIGININFAPVLDINTNPKNPIIGSRSFGSNKKNVARRGLLYAKGLNESGVLACAKHFPGHGDTVVDSHKSLPVVAHSQKRLDFEELYPFKEFIDERAGAVMVAHLHVPVLDDKKNRPTSLSRSVINGLLRKKLGFDGLVFSDDLRMGAIVNYKPGEAEVMALAAGNDLLVCPENVPIAIHSIKKAIMRNIISEKEVDAHLYRILQTKYKLGLFKNRLVKNPRHIVLNTKHALALKKKLFYNSCTIVKENNKLLPLSRAQKKRTALVCVEGEEEEKNFILELAKKHGICSFFSLPKSSVEKNVDNLLKKLSSSNFDIVVSCFLLDQNRYGLLFSISKHIKKFIAEFSKFSQKTIAGLFFSKQSFLNNLFNTDVEIIAHEKDPFAIEAFFGFISNENISIL